MYITIHMNLKGPTKIKLTQRNGYKVHLSHENDFYFSNTCPLNIKDKFMILKRHFYELKLYIFLFCFY